MIKHLVFFKMKEDADPAAQEKMVAMLRALPAVIPQIKDFEVGVNFATGPAASDISLYSTFENEADMETYRVHPEHQKVVAFIGKVTSERRVVDYEV